MVLTSKQTRAAWPEYLCNTLDWITITVLNRAPVKTIKKLVEAWSAFERVMLASGYGNAGNVSSYSCRWPSLHSYRLANDIDPTLNARQGNDATMDWAKCKLTRAQSDAVERIKTNSGAQVFRNGWVFRNPDPMHFQIACTQADIESGIDWSTVEVDGEVPPPEYEDDDMTYEQFRAAEFDLWTDDNIMDAWDRGRFEDTNRAGFLAWWTSLEYVDENGDTKVGTRTDRTASEKARFMTDYFARL